MLSSYFKNMPNVIPPGISWDDCIASACLPDPIYKQFDDYRCASIFAMNMRRRMVV